MTHRRDIEIHRHRLVEIRKIIDSMKTLAYLETVKLGRLISARHKLEKNINAIAADFLHFNPGVLPKIEPTAQVFLLVGSQRGFCGNFNDSLLELKQLADDQADPQNTSLIVVGERLQSHLENMPFKVTVLEGANVAEEIAIVVENIVRTITKKKQPIIALHALYHSAEDNSILSEELLPPFCGFAETPQNFAHPPLLNFPPEEFFLELTDYYLFSALRRILYDSLMAENQQRLQHLENAINHLDNKTTELVRKGNALRQEEIIEEIEVILLNSSVSSMP